MDLRDKSVAEAEAIAAVRFIFFVARPESDMPEKGRGDDALEKGRADDVTTDAESSPAISEYDHFPVLEATAGAMDTAVAVMVGLGL